MVRRAGTFWAELMLTSLPDLAALADAIDPHCPSGDDLAYTDRYAEMERLAQGRAEQQYGEAIFEAQEPAWESLLEQALELAAHTHDLRVGVYLTLGLTRIRGLAGLANGLELLACWLANEWDTLYPALDPDDGDEAVERSNIMLELCDRSRAGLLHAPLASSEGVGTCNLREIQIARGERSADSPRKQLTLADVRAIFSAADRGALESTRADVVRSEQSLGRIIEVFESQTGTFPTLDPMAALLKEIREVIDELAPEATPMEPKTSPGTVSPSAASAMGASATASSSSATLDRLHVGSRSDVVTILDALCVYYEHNEPSSPVPLLLQKARGLVDMDFLDIVRNLAPDGLADVSRWAGCLDSCDEN